MAQSPDAAVVRGQALFTRNCSFCHGPTATGGAEGPNLIFSAVVRHDKDGDLIGQVIRDGRPAKGMPAFSLADVQIADIAAYLHHRLTETDLRSPNQPNNYSLKLLLTGDADKGRIFFQTHCRSCHSPERDLKGIAGRLDPTNLQARLLYPDGVAKTVTVTDKEHQTYAGELIYADPFTVDMRDKEGNYRSWDPNSVSVSIANPIAAHLQLLPKYTEADLHNVFAYLETLR